MLRCRMNCKLDKNLVDFLKNKNVDTPEKLFLEMSLYPTKKRRPFDSIMFYWVALGYSPPQCTEEDVKQLKHDFDNIFFAWKRLGFQPPRFPYAYLLRKIVHSKPDIYSPGIQQMTRFVRKLRCASRRARYDELFKECVEFDYSKNLFREFNDPLYQMRRHTPIPDKLPKQIVTFEKNEPKMIDVANVRNVYKSQEEYDEAVKNGTFDVAKTFHMDKHGKLYCLCVKPDVSMQRLSIQNESSVQLQATQELNKLLDAQSNLS